MGEHPINVLLSKRDFRRVRAPLVTRLVEILAASVFAGFPQAFAAESSLRPKLPEAPDTHRVLVIPVDLRGRAPLTVDRKQILQALYGAGDSVASRYRDVSYGKMEFAGSDGDIVDPISSRSLRISATPDWDAWPRRRSKSCSARGSHGGLTNTSCSSSPGMHHAGGPE